MVHNELRLEVPFEERLMISPEARAVAFKQIYTGYTRRFGMKLLYAFLNYDAEEMTDYLVVYKVRNMDNTADLAMFDMVPIHSDRCTPNYRYYKQQGKVDNFFKLGLEEMATMELSRFYEYIQEYLQLSRNKDDKNYWKSPENAGELCRGLLDIALRYKVKK